MSRKWILLILGLIVGSGFTYWSLKSFSWNIFVSHISDVDVFLLMVSAMGFVLLPLVKAWRWKIILNPLQQISLKEILPITALGYASVMVIPFRLGEIVRPALLQKDYEVKFATGLSSILVERVFDLSTLVLLVVVSGFIHALPDDNNQEIYISAAISLVIFAGMILFYRFIPLIQKIISYDEQKKPESFKDKFISFIFQFLKGFASVQSVGSFVYIFSQSILAWILNALAIYFLLLAFGFDLPFVASIYMLGFVLLAISIPTAPGFIGSFQAGCIWALTVFSIAQPEASSFAWAYYIWANGIKLVLGILSLYVLKLSWADMKKLFQIKSN